MIEAFKGETIVRKVGGRFRLTALIQRRLKELIEGARPLVETKGRTLLEVVAEEIMQDKISVDYERTTQLKPPDKFDLEQQMNRGIGQQEEDEGLVT